MNGVYNTVSASVPYAGTRFGRSASWTEDFMQALSQTAKTARIRE